MNRLVVGLLPATLAMADCGTREQTTARHRRRHDLRRPGTARGGGVRALVGADPARALAADAVRRGSRTRADRGAAGGRAAELTKYPVTYRVQGLLICGTATKPPGEGPFPAAVSNAASSTPTSTPSDSDSSARRRGRPARAT